MVLWPAFELGLNLRSVQLANLFQLNAQPVAKRALGSEFIEQCFGFLKSVRRNVLGLEQITKATLNFGFGKQGALLGDGSKTDGL